MRSVLTCSALPVPYTVRQNNRAFNAHKSPRSLAGLPLGVVVQDLFRKDSRRAPVSRLAPGYSVYRRPRMAEEGVPANAELV